MAYRSTTSNQCAARRGRDGWRCDRCRTYWDVDDQAPGCLTPRDVYVRDTLPMVAALSDVPPTWYIQPHGQPADT